MNTNQLNEKTRLAMLSILEDQNRALSALKQSETRFRSVIENSFEGISIVDEDGKIFVWNNALEMLTGKSAYEIIGRNIWDVQYDLIPESDRNPKRHDQLKSTLQKTLKSGKASYLNIPIEQNYLRNDGKNLILSAKINSVKTEKGYLLVSVTRDITEQRVAEEKIKKLNEELEQKVIERTAQLEFLNKELESFSYTVSHDLRAPLRSIAGFSQILQDEYSGIMDEQGRTYLNRLTDGAKLMSNLINDLLNLSRITRTKKNVSEINLSAIIQSFANEYQNNDTKRKANFIIQPDLYILADLALMRILVQNLMENAWKFTSKKPKAIIEFGQLEINEKKVFFIRDNGSGFDMKYANKLFIPFNRLHTSDEFEGTGIGLATVHRIISRHNGKIWAESEIDKGTTF
ncbi:MAG: ATP-binding protein, partial [Bacteroidota bacterium]